MAVIQILWSDAGGVRSPNLIKGQLWLNTADKRLYSHDGVNLFPLEAVSAIGATAPVNPDDGTLWFDAANLALKIWDELNLTWQSAGAGNNAAGIAYDNTGSGLTATDVQAAIDELALENDNQDAAINNNSANIATNNAAIAANQAQIVSNDADILALQTSDGVQDGRLDALETNDSAQDTRLDAGDVIDADQDARLDAVEAGAAVSDAELARLENDKVDRAGDTMTGDLTMSNQSIHDALIDSGQYV